MEELLGVLRSIVLVLRPFGVTVSGSSRVWNGAAFAPAPDRRPDPYALAWATSLGEIIAMLQLQGVPITAGQIAHLKKELLGGMGSLADFRVDTRAFGEEARRANARLDGYLSQLFAILGELEQTAKTSDA